VRAAAAWRAVAVGVAVVGLLGGCGQVAAGSTPSAGAPAAAAGSGGELLVLAAAS
jgi:uncharacterized protein YceK